MNWKGIRVSSIRIINNEIVNIDHDIKLEDI